MLIDDKVEVTGVKPPEWEHVLFYRPYLTHHGDKIQGRRILRHWADWRDLFTRADILRQARLLKVQRKQSPLVQGGGQSPRHIQQVMLQTPLGRNEAIADGWALTDWVQSLPISQVISRHLERMAPELQTGGDINSILTTLSKHSSSEALVDLLSGAWKEAAELLREEASAFVEDDDKAGRAMAGGAMADVASRKRRRAGGCAAMATDEGQDMACSQSPAQPSCDSEV